MPRCARLKKDSETSWYHIYSRVNGTKNFLPLGDHKSRNELIRIIKFYTEAYCLEVMAFCVMGNHYHLVVEASEASELSREELLERALWLYPGQEEAIKKWPEEKWERLNERLFDISEFMRNVQARFARWYNNKTGRRGALWADRFKSTLLESGKAVLEAMYYVELNPIRAGLVKRPEDYEGSSYYQRCQYKAGWLKKLTDILDVKSAKVASWEYRNQLYHRGNIPAKKGLKIPDKMMPKDKTIDLIKVGAYRNKLRYFIDGLVFGKQKFVQEELNRFIKKGWYHRRKYPSNAPCGPYQSLREQRSHGGI